MRFLFTRTYNRFDGVVLCFTTFGLTTDRYLLSGIMFAAGLCISAVGEALLERRGG